MLQAEVRSVFVCHTENVINLIHFTFIHSSESTLNKKIPLTVHVNLPSRQDIKKKSHCESKRPCSDKGDIKTQQIILLSFSSSFTKPQQSVTCIKQPLIQGLGLVTPLHAAMAYNWNFSILFIFFKCFGCWGKIGSSEWPADEAAGAVMNRRLIAGSPRCKLLCLPPLTTGNYWAAVADALCIFIAPAGHIDQQLTSRKRQWTVSCHC